MAWKKQLAVLLSVTALAIFAESYCPDEEFIQPCFCAKNERTILTCSQIDKVRVLETVANNSDGYVFSEVRVENSTLEFIPKAFLEKIRTQDMILKDLELNKLVDGIPNTNDKLEHLMLQRIRCKNRLSWEDFSKTPHLESLIVDDLEVPAISEDFNKFVTPTLKRLYLRNTNTKKIDEGALEGFNNLTAFSLTNNDLKTLKRESFPRPFLVEILLLTNNNLTEISDDLLTDMPNLKTVFLNENKLSTINAPLFAGDTSNLRYANFIGNPIHCDCKLKWITTLKPKSLKGVCMTPKELRGKDLRQLEEEDLKC